MKKILFTLLICLIASFSFAESVFMEGFEYGNHDLEVPVGWVCNDNSWLAGFQEKDHNRIPHEGNWYAFTDADESWMFMEFFMSSELKYRYHFWGISDGEYDVEFWAGSGPSTSEMTTLLMTRTVNGGEYEHFSEYIETVATNYQFFGIHAIAHEGAYHLTIDNVYIDLVGKYDMEVTPMTFDTYMMPGDQITIEYDVQNTGYEDLTIYMTPYTDYFSNISFTVDGNTYSPFPTVPNQVVHCSCTATLNPGLALGTRCWIDIMFTVSCDCVTRMATLWVTVGEDTTEVPEYTTDVQLYPNPAQGSITIEGTGQVTVSNAIGQTVLTQWMDGKETFSLPKGFYLIRLENGDKVSVEKLIVE
jgi:hypothetical protein